MADLENPEENKIPAQLHRNELFKEPTAHEKNSLLTSLRNKLDNIDEIIKKTKQSKNTVTETEETKQKTLNEKPLNTHQQILEEKPKEEAIHTEISENVPNNPISNEMQPPTQKLLELKPKDEIKQTKVPESITSNAIPLNPISDEICNLQPSHQKLLELKPKDEIKQTEVSESTTSNAIPQTQKNQNDAVEQIVTTQLESKPSPAPQESPQPIPPTVPKDYSHITTFGEADEAIKAEPENYKHYVAIAELYIKKQDYKNGETNYKKAQELTQSKDVEVLKGLAKIYDLSAQPADALIMYTKALELNPSSIEILNSRAHCYETLGQEENFFKDIEKAIEIAPNNAQNYISRAEHYMAKNDFQKSLDDVNKIITLKPDNASVMYFRGILNYNLQNYQGCFSDMQKALELKTDENEIYRYLGICSYKSNDLNAAINFLKKSIEFGFDSGDVYHYKAYTEFKLGLYDAALGDSDKSIEKDSQKYEYYFLRAKIYNEKNIIDKAEKDYDKALKLNPSFDAFVERGEFFAKHEKYKDAIKNYTAAITLNNQNTEVYKQRGYVYQKLNKNEEAEADFEQALKLNPSTDVTVENKNISQAKAHHEKEQVHSHQEVSEVKQKTLQTPTDPIAQTNVEPIKNEPQETTVTSKNNTTNQLQDIQQHEEQKVETPINQTPPHVEAPLAPQETKAEVKTKTESEQIITPQENNEKKPKKEGLFARLFKKNAKASQKNENEPNAPIPSVHPSDVETAYNRANINYKNKKYEAALDDLSKIFSKESAYAKGYLLRANVYADTGNATKALEDLNKVIELSPQTFLAYFKRAEIYYLQNNDDAAFADFEKTIGLNQKFGGGYVGIAKIYAKLGDKEKAIENYNLAKKHDLKYSKIADTEIKTLLTS
jgi:tetratricopeptide (TPR) repeat protein